MNYKLKYTHLRYIHQQTEFIFYIKSTQTPKKNRYHINKRIKMKTILLFTVLFFLATSCFKESDNSYYSKKTDLVDIIATHIPDTTANMEQVQISARAAAENGCWKDLYFRLIKNSEFDYTLKSYGNYESNGICPVGMIYKDTTITFLPIKKGTYLFHITRVPYEDVVDTMLVN